MWETDFSSRAPRFGNLGVGSKIDPASIEAVALLYWREHCLECSPPDCYASCKLYQKRSDLACARLTYGIAPNRGYNGLFSYGADIEFRRWGIITAKALRGSVTRDQARKIDRIDRALIRLARPVNAALFPIDKRQLATRILVRSRAALLERISRKADPDAMQFDEFLIEVFNPGDELVRLIVEASSGNRRFRTALDLTPGHNSVGIPVADLPIDLRTGRGMLKMYPDNNAEIRLIYTWADLVRYRQKAKSAHAPQVKCVVWDLDNTLWTGTLVEDGPEGIRVRDGVVELIKELDRRGIVQSVASKNDHGPALGVLKQHDLAEYFLYPQINWGPKSASMKVIAERLNIHLDTFAFIEDSPNERNEVTSAYPEVRAYPHDTLERLLSLDEFDVPITEASANRRKYYQAEYERTQAETEQTGDHDEFLRRCEVEIRLFPPATEAEIDRCFELVQRTNQLNLSTVRYDKADFLKLLSDQEVICLGTHARDRFGEYGIVGFAAVRISHGRAQLLEYVQSCRIANKRVEPAWFKTIGARVRDRSINELHATFIPSKRNHMLREVLASVGFDEIGDSGAKVELVLPLQHEPDGSNIVRATLIGWGPLANEGPLSGQCR